MSAAYDTRSLCERAEEFAQALEKGAENTRRLLERLDGEKEIPEALLRECLGTNAEALTLAAQFVRLSTSGTVEDR